MIDLNDILYSLSKSIDIIHKNFEDHSKQVAFLSLCFVKALDRDKIDINELFKASLLHDVGAIYLQTKNISGIFEERPEDIKTHEQYGYNLLKNYDFFKKTAEIVLYHHRDYNEELNSPYTLYSQIIHLADRLAVLFEFNTKSLSDISHAKIKINEYIKTSSSGKFNPDLIEIFYDEIFNKSDIWFALHEKSKMSYKSLAEIFNISPLNVDFKDSIFLFKFFGEVINSHSSFTKYHSERVSKVANLICNEIEFPVTETLKIQVAAFLHDLGKLSVPVEILDKRGGLTDDEHDLMKMHPLMTASVLKAIDAFQDVVIYASYHHEFLDGSGYPYGKKDRDIPLGARIVSIADLAASFLENRPYRDAMTVEQAINLIETLAHHNKIDRDLVRYLIKNSYIFDQITHIDQLRIEI